MKETILFAPTLNQTELLRTLAKHGVNTLGLRVMNGSELSKFGLMHSGISITEEFITSKEETALIATLLDGIEYFQLPSYSDAQNITAALNEIRYLIPTNESNYIDTVLKNGEFVQKNEALIELFHRLCDYLSQNNKIDGISLIRKAIENAKPINADIIYLSEFPLSPLEFKLAYNLSNGYVKETSLFNLFKVEKIAPKIEVYAKAYGASNEVEYVFGTIAKNKIPIDKCTVAVTDNSSYGQLFFDFCNIHNIPVTFGSGVPISNSNPAELLKLLNEWNTSGYNGIDALNAILDSDAFNREKAFSVFGKEEYNINDISKTIGNLRLSFNKEENSKKIEKYRNTLPESGNDVTVLNQAEQLIALFEEGASGFIEKYSVIRKEFMGRIDRSACKVISDTLNAYLSIRKGNDFTEIMPDILSKTVCSENSREGALFITNIGSAVAALRENLFAVGLSANNFPGSPKENYLLLDSDYLLFGKEGTVPTSEKRIKDKTKSFFELINFASAIGNKTFISYPYYNLSELKDQNQSSVLFELFKKTCQEVPSFDDFQAATTDVTFFTQKVNDYDALGQAYLSGQKAQITEVNKTNNTVVITRNTFSPTEIERYITCPRKFYLNAVLRIPEPDTNNIFDVIDNRERGNLVHKMMETLVNKKSAVSKDEFINAGLKLLENSFCSRPPIHEIEIQNEKDDYISILENAYNMENETNYVVSYEEKATVPHRSGIILSGKADRVEKKANGKYIISDFKTGNKIRHIENDFATCLQGLLYAYMQKELNNYDIEECEFKYLRNGKTVKCKFDDSYQAQIDELLIKIKTDLDNGIFESNENNCESCKYKDICNLEVTESEAE